MPCFDLETWRLRTISRLARAMVRNQRSCMSTFISDWVACEEIERLIRWCKSQKINVRFDSTPDGLYVSKTIAVNSRMRPENQLHVLLHECGHHLVNQRPPRTRFRNNDDGHMIMYKRTNLYHIDLLDEELEAWNRGLRLAIRLNLRLNLDRFNQTRAKYVRSYTTT